MDDNYQDSIEPVFMDIYQFTDYREYLKALYESEKKRSKFFSYRYLARMAGFSSASFLKLVIDGKKKMAPASINKCAKGFKLNKKETAYFEAMVLFNQAETEKEKDFYFDRLVALRPKVDLTGIEKDQYEYMARHYIVAIREMTAIKDFREDPEWIAQQFRPVLKVKEVTHAIELLLRLGLLKRDESGKLMHGDTALSTPPEINATEAYSYHRSILNAAKETLLVVDSKERDLAGVTVPVSKRHIQQIKEKISEFRQEVMDIVNKEGAPYDDVYQVSLQLFPLTYVNVKKNNTI